MYIFRRPAQSYGQNYGQNYGQSYGQNYGHETIPFEENEIPEEDDEDDIQGECVNHLKYHYILHFDPVM